MTEQKTLTSAPHQQQEATIDHNQNSVTDEDGMRQLRSENVEYQP